MKLEQVLMGGELMPEKDIKILLPISQTGGYGDVIAVGEYLQNVDLPFEISFERGAEEKFEYLTQHSKEWKRYKSSDNDIVSICTIYDSRTVKQTKKTKYSMLIGEYDASDSVYNVSKNFSLNIRTGLGFNEDSPMVQSGIYIRPNLEFILNTVDNAIKKDKNNTELKKELLEELSEKQISVKRLLDWQQESAFDSKYSLAYTSEIERESLFYGIVESAQDKLTNNLIIFSTASENRQPYIQMEAKGRGFSYINNVRIKKRNSPITIIELGAIKESSFMDLLGVADTLSLITGDHSLSQILQKSQHKCSVPFFYQAASWKYRLSSNLHRLMKQTSPDAADLFAGYVLGTSTMQGNEFTGLGKKLLDKEDFAKLVYDKETIKDYNTAIKSIKNIFINERREAGIEKPEILWSVNETIGHIIQNLKAGNKVLESQKELIPRE